VQSGGGSVRLSEVQSGGGLVRLSEVQSGEGYYRLLEVYICEMCACQRQSLSEV